MTGEDHTGRQGDEELEHGPLRVLVADRCRDRREPFLRVAPEFVLDDLVVVEGKPDEKGTEEGACQDEEMLVGESH